MLSKIKKNYALYAFLINLVAGIIAFSGFIIHDRGLFSIAGDYNVQQIPFAMYANNAIKSGNIVWDWSLDLGSNFIGGMTFYVLGNPSFWLSLLFPADAFIYIAGWIYVLKYAFAGLTAFLWISRFVKKPENAVTASVLYAFSGFMNEDLLFYHFHDVALLFPLLLLTFDWLMEEHRHGPFIFAVTVNVLVNYFFFPGEVYFLAAYFILRYVVDGGRKMWRRLPEVFAEGILGCLLGMILLLPAAIFVVQNPRVKFDYVGSNSLVFGADRYLFILKSMIFPGEVMSDHSAVINRNFASCAAYLPMIGMVLVIAFLSMNRKHWITRMLKWCLVMAVVPILNASFSLFAGLYHRWYYMCVLLFALCSALVLEQLQGEERIWESPTPSEKAVNKGTLIWLLITAGFIMFLLFVPWSSSEKSKIFRPDLFYAWSVVSSAGTLATWVILTKFKKWRREILTAGILMFAVGTTITTIHLYHVANGEDAVHLQDRLVTSKDFGIETTAYRYSNNDNPETLTHGYSTRANFCSTVSGSIFRFYQTLGLKREVKSPDPPDGLLNLISARYTYETKEKSDAGKLVKTVKGKYKTYYIYEDESVPPIGFTYETYMPFSVFEKTADEKKAILMLKTLVIPDEEEETVGKILRKYDEGRDGEPKSSDISKISSAHISESSRNVRRTTSDYVSDIHCEKDCYAFFSIPNDSGWSCHVDGTAEEILDINGFMAVRLHAGDNTVHFHYKVPGLSAGVVISLVSLAASILWILFFRRERKRKKA